MKKVLLVEERPNQKLLYSLNLYLYAGADVVCTSTVDEAIEWVSNYSDNLGAIVARVDDDEMAVQLSSFLKHSGIKVPLVAVGDKRSSSHIQVGKLDLTAKYRNMVRATAKILGVTPNSMAARQVEEYFSVPTSFLISRVCYGASLFVMTKEGKILKVLDEGEYFLEEELEILKSQGHDKLYLFSNERLKFANSYSEELIRRISDESLTDSERATYADSAQKLVHEQARKIGISEQTISLGEASIDFVRSSSEQVKGLKSLLDSLFSDDLSFRYRESHLITYIAFHILGQTSWGGKEHRQKMATAAFYHDLALTNDGMALVRTEKEIENSDYSLKEKETILNHASIAANILSRFENIPTDAVAIVRQHHGVPTGLGFEGISNSIQPMSAIFVLASEWANLILMNEENHIKLNRTKVLEHLKEKYDFAVYRKLWAYFENLGI